MDDSKTPPEDDDLFAQEMRDVQPLRAASRHWPEPMRTRPVPQQSLRDEARVLQELLQPADDELGLETGEELLFLRTGYPPRLLRQLRRGRFSIEDSIDLHGMTEATAREVLVDFLAYACDSRLGCVRIIHGKGLRSPGEPKLKRLSNEILRRHKAVVWGTLQQGRERARTAAGAVCRQHGLVLMDDTVIFQRIRWNQANMRSALALGYRFEFVHRGIRHSGGQVWISGNRAITVILETAEGQLIERFGKSGDA